MDKFLDKPHAEEVIKTALGINLSEMALSRNYCAVCGKQISGGCYLSAKLEYACSPECMLELIKR